MVGTWGGAGRRVPQGDSPGNLVRKLAVVLGRSALQSGILSDLGFFFVVVFSCYLFYKNSFIIVKLLLQLLVVKHELRINEPTWSFTEKGKRGVRLAANPRERKRQRWGSGGWEEWRGGGWGGWNF